MFYVIATISGFPSSQGSGSNYTPFSSAGNITNSETITWFVGSPPSPAPLGQLVSVGVTVVDAFNSVAHPLGGGQATPFTLWLPLGLSNRDLANYVRIYVSVLVSQYVTVPARNIQILGWPEDGEGAAVVIS